MTKGRFGGSEKRRSPRYDRRLSTLLEYDGTTYEMRTIDISKYGVLIPRRMPPPIGTTVTLTLTIRDNRSIFEGIVKRHTKCLVNGVQTVGIGIDISSPEYLECVKEIISNASLTGATLHKYLPLEHL
jgi:hypothetical protein